LTAIFSGTEGNVSGKSGCGSGRESHMKDHARARIKRHRQRGATNRKLRETGLHTLKRNALPAIVGHHKRRSAGRADRDLTKVECVRGNADTGAGGRRKKCKTKYKQSNEKTHKARAFHTHSNLHPYSRARSERRGDAASSRSSRFLLATSPYELLHHSSTGEENRFGTGSRDSCKGNRHLSASLQSCRTLVQYANKLTFGNSLPRVIS